MDALNTPVTYPLWVIVSGLILWVLSLCLAIFCQKRPADKHKTANNYVEVLWETLPDGQYGISAYCFNSSSKDVSHIAVYEDNLGPSDRFSLFDRPHFFVILDENLSNALMELRDRDRYFFMKNGNSVIPLLS